MTPTLTQTQSCLYFRTFLVLPTVRPEPSPYPSPSPSTLSSTRYPRPWSPTPTASSGPVLCTRVRQDDPGLDLVQSHRPWRYGRAHLSPRHIFLPTSEGRSRPTLPQPPYPQRGPDVHLRLVTHRVRGGRAVGRLRKDEPQPTPHVRAVRDNGRDAEAGPWARKGTEEGHPEDPRRVGRRAQRGVLRPLPPGRQRHPVLGVRLVRVAQGEGRIVGVVLPHTAGVGVSGVGGPSTTTQRGPTHSDPVLPGLLTRAVGPEGPTWESRDGTRTLRPLPSNLRPLGSGRKDPTLSFRPFPHRPRYETGHRPRGTPTSGPVVTRGSRDSKGLSGNGTEGPTIITPRHHRDRSLEQRS